MARFTDVFYDLLKETMGIEPLDNLIATGPLRDKKLDSRLLEAAYAAVPEIDLLENPLERAEAATEIRHFEAKLRVRSKGGDMSSVTKGIGLSWSKDAPALLQLMRNERRTGGPSKYTLRSFLLSHFSELKLSNLGLTELDAATATFSGLRELNVSGNKLTCLEHLPGDVVSVCAYANDISAVGPRNAPSGDASQPSPLVHLGLGYNVLNDDSLYSVTRLATSAVVLDLAYNRLTDLPTVIRSVQDLDSLRHLVSGVHLV